jgi:hypothetical protein
MAAQWQAGTGVPQADSLRYPRIEPTVEIWPPLVAMHCAMNVPAHVSAKATT